MDVSLVVIVVLAFGLTAAAVWVLGTPRDDEHSLIAQRLRSYAVQAWQPSVAAGASVLRRREYSRFPWLDAVLRRLDLADDLSRRLRQAGLPMRAGEFALVQLAFAGLAALLALLLVPYEWRGLITAAPAALVGFAIPRLWLGLKRARRVSAFEEGLSDALDMVAGSLRAGHGLAHGLDLVARESSGPCAEEFGQVLQELNLGADVDVALARMVNRLGSEDAQLLATAVAVQRRTGGNLVEVFGQMSHVMRERLRLRRDVRVLTTAPRVSGYVVGLLPVLTVGVMFFTSRYYVELLFVEPVGHLLLAAGACLTLIGLFLNHRIAQVDM